MRIWAFDPGSEETGVAYVKLGHDNKVAVCEAMQSTHLSEVWEFYLSLREHTDTTLIEDYRSGGFLTKDAKATIEVIGALKFAVEQDWDYGSGEWTLRVEQHRLSGQRDAAKVMRDTIDTLAKDKSRKDAFSALSHCFAYWRTLYG